MKIVITGASGQDGMFMINNLLNNSKSQIYACTRNIKNFDFNKLHFLNNNSDFERITLVDINFQNFEEVYKFFRDTKPHHVFNMMGPSSVSKFIQNPESMMELTLNSHKNITDSLIKTRNFCNFYQASSSEMYGYDSNSAFDESSDFKPNSTYAKAKQIVHSKSLKYEKEYDWNIVSGIMFNHESEFRNSNFLIMKLVEKIIEIKRNKNIKFEFPNLEISRDWSYAGDISDAVINLTLNDFTGPFVIGSGKAVTLKEIMLYMFDKINSSYEDHVLVNPDNERLGEPLKVVSNPEKIKKSINWESRLSIFEVLDKMYAYKTTKSI